MLRMVKAAAVVVRILVVIVEMIICNGYESEVKTFQRCRMRKRQTMK
jgi:hypothetical protein